MFGKITLKKKNKQINKILKKGLFKEELFFIKYNPRAQPKLINNPMARAHF